MNKIAIITTPRSPYSNYIVKMAKKYGVDGYYSLKGGFRNYFIRYLRKMIFKYDLPFKELFFDKWKYHLKQYDLIIIIRDQYGEFISEFIASNCNAKVVLYFMDPYKKSVFLKKSRENNAYFISSFEKEICDKNGYIFNPLFCFREDDVNTNIDKDVFFIGTDKGRLEELLEYEKILKNEGLETYFHICKSPGNLYKDSKKYKYKKKISYPELLNYVRKSKALLEILPEGQTDMTLRGYEAYFFKKKFITNNKQIKMYSIYNPKNIFILGEDDINDIKKFVNSEYVDKYDIEMEKTEFGEWIKKYENL